MEHNPNITGSNGLGDAMATMIEHYAKPLPGFPKPLYKGHLQVNVQSVAEEVTARLDGFVDKEKQ